MHKLSSSSAEKAEVVAAWLFGTCRLTTGVTKFDRISRASLRLLQRDFPATCANAPCATFGGDFVSSLGSCGCMLFRPT
jgi:hypothetical protein